MSFETLLVTDQAGVRRITINRPDKLNALNRQTISDLHQAFSEAADSEEIRVVVLAGAGEKAFVAGADISELDQLSPIQARDFSRYGQDLMLRIEQLGKPVIAVIQGFALGGGLELAMACHLRIASERARVGQPEVNLGILPGFGGTQRLLRLAGRAATLELCLLGAPIKADRAYQLGIVTRVVAVDQLDSEVDSIATQLAHSAPQALRGVLDAVLRGGETAIEQGLDYETQAFAVAQSTEDRAEGTRAFLEKRKPQFTGR